jgi:CRP/FNR family transcriptional activator FtrB
MKQDPDFCFAVAQELSGCYRGLVRGVKNQKLRGGIERLANYLITQRVRQGHSETIQLPHEKRVLASLLGMTPENLSRAFSSLSTYGVVVKGPLVTIGRPEALERLARPTPLIDNHMPAADTLVGKAEVERWTAPERTYAYA